jgi:hypothetical protein
VRARNAAADLRVSITRTERVYTEDVFAGMRMGVAAEADDITTDGDVMRNGLWFVSGFATGVVIASLALIWIVSDGLWFMAGLAAGVVIVSLMIIIMMVVEMSV